MNLFNRLISDKPNIVFIEDNIDEYKSYEIKRLLNKRVIRRNKD